jgi:hypothetical protein
VNSGTRAGGDQAPFPANRGRGPSWAGTRPRSRQIGPGDDSEGRSKLPVWAAGGPGPVSGNFKNRGRGPRTVHGDQAPVPANRPNFKFPIGGPRRHGHGAGAVPPGPMKGSMLRVSAHSSCARPGCLSWSLPVPNQPSAAFLAAADVRRSNRSSETDVQVGGRTENRSVEVDTQDPLLHKPGPSASLLPTASGKLGAAPGLCLTLFFSVLYSGIWSRIPFLHFGSESITSTKLPRSWN